MMCRPSPCHAAWPCFGHPDAAVMAGIQPVKRRIIHQIYKPCQHMDKGWVSAPPASIRMTENAGFVLSLFARIQPADPAPTITKSASRAGVAGCLSFMMIFILRRSAVCNGKISAASRIRIAINADQIEQMVHLKARLKQNPA